MKDPRIIKYLCKKKKKKEKVLYLRLRYKATKDLWKMGAREAPQPNCAKWQ